MDSKQLKDSGILVVSNLAVNLAGFLRQVIMAWVLGVSAGVDLLLLAMIVPSIIQAMIGGGAGEIMVIKRDRPGHSQGSFETLYIVSCLIPVVLLGALWYLFSGLVTPFFDITVADEGLFRGLSLIFIINMLPGTFTSVLRPHLYSGGHYAFYAVSTIVSQIVGILFIIFTVGRLGIWSFAWSHLISGTMNAVWFSFRAGLKPAGIFSPAVWKHEAEQLVILMKRVFSLSVQTLLNHFATFWERSLSVKYLSAGYLSSLNYSRTLTELPNTVLLSSVLTTSYIEQVRLHKEDYAGFETYTARTLKLIINAGFLFQALMLLLAPVIIILVYRRGRFDNEAVQTTLVIFNIITVGFLPRLVMNFFSRTMYILGEYRKLLLAITIKVVAQISVMVAFINLAGHAIPFAIVAGFMIVALLLYIFMKKHVALPSIMSFVARLGIISLASTALLMVHSYTIDHYIGKSNTTIFLLSLPLMLIASAAILYFMHRNHITPAFITKIRNRIWTK
ncbi:MAG: hypothetical protein IH591_00360 [Bacteroidales bacterium]|nr:hypothetical protein [Bacteroidales bacterium]